jgi:hypothetical protein
MTDTGRNPTPIAGSDAGRMKLARSIDEFSERILLLLTPQSFAAARAFRPRASDVIIATYPKCGTTWVQQIAHGLRTGGDMAFDEITEVVPWLEAALDLGLDLDAEQKAEPRLFKTHVRAELAPPGCRYISVIREPGDALASQYHFMEGWFLERGAVAIDDFVRLLAFSTGPGSTYWNYLLSWWRRRDDPQVLTLSFEDLKEDLEAQVARVARFLATDVARRSIDVATRQATFAFMKTHEGQFDEHLTARARNSACDLPPDAATTKVREGKTGTRRALSDATLALLDERWASVVAPETGFASYAALRAALAERE